MRCRIGYIVILESRQRGKGKSLWLCFKLDVQVRARRFYLFHAISFVRGFMQYCCTCSYGFICTCRCMLVLLRTIMYTLVAVFSRLSHTLPGCSKQGLLKLDRVWAPVHHCIAIKGSGWHGYYYQYQENVHLQVSF